MNDIQGLGMRNNASAALLQAQTAKTDEVKSNSEKNTEDAAAKKAVEQNTDKYVKSSASANSGTYTKNAISKPSASQLMAMEQQRTASFQKMLQSMVTRQGQKSNMAMFGMQLSVSQSDINAAKASIADGGEYSVDAVAGRIMDMAKALAGGDSSKIDVLRKAVEKGFKAAGVDLGGSLPDISNKTHSEVMKRFDEWEKESKGAVTTGATE